MKVDLQAELPKICEWIRERVGSATVVIGVSGGKDSSVTAALCVKALGADKVFGVLMPQGEQADIDKSYMLVKHLGIKHCVVNIGPACDALKEKVLSATGLEENMGYKSNTPARIRMATLYGIGALLGNSRVVNTCNLSEDYVGYSTKFGDAAGDFSPLSRFTAGEVVALGDLLGLPYELSHKVPTDGMCGMTDEDRFGFSYATLDAYLRGEATPAPEIVEKIEKMHRASLHKLLPMPVYPLGE